MLHMELPLRWWQQSHSFPDVSGFTRAGAHTGKAWTFDELSPDRPCGLGLSYFKKCNVPHVPISTRLSQFMFNIIATICVDT